jgi:hypothetical protein
VSRASFAVISYVTTAGEPRSSGVVYATAGRHLYVVTAPDSWKARHIHDGSQVAVTVPVRRGGLLSLVAAIPPATVSFTARAIAHPAGSVQVAAVSKRLASMVPEERRDGCVVLDLVPDGAFVTYGVGVPLRTMRIPAIAQARVPISRVGS